MTADTSNDRNSSTRAGSGAADAVRQAFAALPFDEKISTLLRVELDIVGDIADVVVSAASRAADEIARAFSSSGPTSSSHSNPSDRPASS